MRTIHSTRSAIRAVAAMALGVAALSSSACSDRPDGPMLTAPSLVQPPAPPGAAATGPSKAILAISGLSITVGTNADQPGTFYLNEKFTLTETGGTSGATIQEIWSSVAGGESNGTGPGCWRTAIRVAPGSTTDAFDAGWDDLLYCATFAVGSVPATVSISVGFVDDDGRYGSVETSTVVTR